MKLPASQEILYRFTVPGPVGDLICLSRHDRIVGLAFPGHLRILNVLSRDAVVLSEPLEELRSALRNHLTSTTTQRASLEMLPLEWCGSTFQRKVWLELTQIPCGQTRSYSDIAAALGNGLHPRAVARAVAANPLLILIPCHRVISKNGALSGYSGGIENKKRLLSWEQQNVIPAWK